MTGQASRRLIDAAATLDPADRALLNLWLHRGLDDERLAALTGMTVDSVRQRRERLVDTLSAALGLPELDVSEALRMLRGDADPTDDAAPAQNAVATPDIAGGVVTEPATLTTTPIGPPPSAIAAPEDPAALDDAAATGDAAPPGDAADPVGAAPLDASPPASGRRTRVWLGITVAVAVIVAAVLVILLSGGGSVRRAAAVTSTSSSSSSSASQTATTPTADPTSVKATSSAARAGPRVQALVALPGGLMHASGRVTLIKHGRHIKLRLTVRGLPHVRGGHYEAWLYNTVLDSRALGRVRTHGTETYRLPLGGRRYTAIDISYQPRGSVNESGESRLRALNPAHYALKPLADPASRTRHGKRATRRARARRRHTKARHHRARTHAAHRTKRKKR